MRPLIFGLLIAATACVPPSQRTPRSVAGHPSDPCYEERNPNQGYDGLFGKIVGVKDAVTLLVAVERRYLPLSFKPDLYCSPAGCKVRLVNLDPPATHSVEASRRLAKLIKKNVSLGISHVQNTDGALNALVWVDTRAINEEQLAAGLATYRDFGPYAVDNLAECQLQYAQKRPRQNTGASGRGRQPEEP